MIVRINIPEGMELLELARFCGTAPCVIVAANGVQTENELGRDIVVPVSTAAMVRSKHTNAFAAAVNSAVSFNANCSNDAGVCRGVVHKSEGSAAQLKTASPNGEAVG